MNNNRMPETPITNHPKLPDEIPLIADFNDDRNRLSYYHPQLETIKEVRTPLTLFLPVNGGKDTYLHCDYRRATQFMQEISATRAFIRGDYSSAKYSEDGRIVNSQDPSRIEETALELFRQLSLAKRNIGGKIAIREHIPHETEVRYFIEDGQIIYRGSLDDPTEFPDEMAIHVTKEFNSLSWSVDFIQHERTGKWYCIDMGLNGLYHNGEDWIAISEHVDKKRSPEKHRDKMAEPTRYQHRR
jgi:hypothetical protein